VDAYNAVISIVQKQLSPDAGTDREATLAGDPTLRSLQARLQRLGATSIPSLATVRTLADLGVKTARDGSLSIDASTLGAAIGRDPAAVNALFASATDGIAAGVGTLVEGFTRAGDGVLASRKASLDRTVRAMDDQAAALQARLDKYRENLVAQFTAMEATISRLKASGSFLAQIGSGNGNGSSA
jgi:flagellar hook-associated protein 2